MLEIGWSDVVICRSLATVFMDWLYAVLGILLAVGVVFLLGWSDKNVKSPAALAAIWIGSILALLGFRWGIRSLLLLLLVLRFLEHIPLWFVYVMAIGIGFYFIALRLANSTVELAQEIEKTNARMQLMEESFRDKLNEISRRLPEE